MISLKAFLSRGLYKITHLIYRLASARCPPRNEESQPGNHLAEEGAVGDPKQQA